MAIKHIFFDLDHTLWDFDTNAYHTLDELFHEFGYDRKLPCSSDEFIQVYQRINDEQWALYRNGDITKDILRTSRYRLTFEHFGYTNEAEAGQFGDLYIQRCPRKTALCDGCIELLDELRPKYDLHIITNGFSEVQPVKMRESGLDSYFKVTMTSERADCKKPGAPIFLKAMDEAGAQAHSSIMIGDSFEADVIGAENIGMKAVLYDPNDKYPEVLDRKINHLSQVLNHL